MSVKENEKAGLKLNIQKTKIMASGPITAWQIEREKFTTKITVPSKDLIQNCWRNKKLFRQAKVKRIQYRKTSFTTNVKGTYIVKKYKRKKKKDQQNQP